MIEQTLMFRVAQDAQAGSLGMGGEIKLSSVLHGQNHGVLPQSLFGTPVMRRQEVIFVNFIVSTEAVGGLTLAPRAAGFGDGGRRRRGQLGGEDNQALRQTPVSQRGSTQLALGPIVAAIRVQ